jgi:hypothetical protein
MSNKGKALEPKLALDMPFETALQRFMQAKPKEVEASIERSKKKKPPKAKAVKKKKKTPGRKKAPPGALGETQSVVSLRDRRIKKRNGR